MSALTATVFAIGAMLSPAQASPAATSCPPLFFNAETSANLALNPSFETVGPNGATSNCIGPPQAPQCVSFPGKVSAAANWHIHTDNAGHSVSTNLTPTTVPGGTAPPPGQRMLHIRAGGTESGVIQVIQRPPRYIMVSAWVNVLRGTVQLTANGGNTGPASHSTKKNQWEQLRVCTDGTVPTGAITILNQAPNGGDFVVDRVEAHAIGPQP